QHLWSVRTDRGPSLWSCLPPALRPLPSFPTRRSSDLDGFHQLALADRQVEVDLLRARGHHRAPGVARGGDEGGLVHPCQCLPARSEEHTSELQSRENLVCPLLREPTNRNRRSRRRRPA